jgi:hypothetical protein
VNASTFSLAVITLAEPQNGHATGVGGPSRWSSSASDFLTFVV